MAENKKMFCLVTVLFQLGLLHCPCLTLLLYHEILVEEFVYLVSDIEIIAIDPAKIKQYRKYRK
jgi:hypothetical protein